MSLKSRSEVVRVLAREIGNGGESIMRWGGLAVIVGGVTIALGFQYNEHVALWGGGTVLGGGVGMLILGWMATQWSSKNRAAANKLDELYPEN